jgi:hypothetical protein
MSEPGLAGERTRALAASEQRHRQAYSWRMPTADHRRLRAAEAAAQHQLENADAITEHQRAAITEQFRTQWHTLRRAERNDMLELALLNATPSVIGCRRASSSATSQQSEQPCSAH